MSTPCGSFRLPRPLFVSRFGGKGGSQARLIERACPARFTSFARAPFAGRKGLIVFSKHRRVFSGSRR